MTWEPEGNKIAGYKLGSLEPEEVLYEFEGEPLTFVARDPDGDPLLLHNVMAFDRTTRYVVSAIDARILGDLKAGRLDILTALRQPRCWVADVTEDGSVKTLWRVEFSSIPEKVLPKPGAMVNPADDPVFRLRLIGSGVGPGKTSAADVRMAAQAAESGLRGLARIALDQKKKVGTVPGNVRHYSDLPYLFSRAASFEIAFGRPRDRLPGIDEEVFAEMGQLLERGLKAVRAENGVLPLVEGLDADQTLQLFEVIRSLSPPTRGDVERVEIGGELVDQVSGSRVLTRDDRVRSVQRVKASRKAPRKEAPFRVSGVIEEADQGNLGFTLRQLDPAEASAFGNATEIAFRFEEHLYDTVMEAFNTLERMVVVGERVDSTYQALDVQLAVAGTDAGTAPEVPGSK